MYIEGFYQKKNLIFIHIPKTGGCSIENVLMKDFLNKKDKQGVLEFNQALKKNMVKNKKWAQHFSLQEIESHYKVKSIKEAIKFTVVRNPWNRVVSEYLYMIKVGGCKCSNKKEEIPKSFFEYVCSGFGCSWENHTLPQVSFLKNKQGGVDMDFVARFENFEEDVTNIFKKIGVSHELPLPMFNPSFNNYLKYTQPYWSFYNKKTKNIIESIYSEDIETFGYEFPFSIF